MFSPELADQVDSSQVLPALARVDEVYQAAVALFYLEDCSYKDIADILEVPIGTVKSRIARGIMQLREILQSADSRGSSLNRDQISTTVSPVELAAPSEDTRPRSARHSESPARTVEPGYDDWDFSSTRLGEQFGAA